MANCTILIIDDHALFRTGLNMILKQQDTIETIHEAGSIMEALKLDTESVNLILSDISMPGLNGLNGLKVLQEHFKGTPVIMLSASAEANDVQDALQLGAKGFLNKSASADEITAAITTVLSGEDCFPADKLYYTPANEEKNPASSLTPRQLQVLALLCEGKPNKTIARELDLAENTVRVHVSSILSMLNVNSRSEAILVAQKQKLIQPAS